jgi:hypothetical protein
MILGENSAVDTWLYSVTLPLFIAAFAVYALIIRDAFPHLREPDRAAIRRTVSGLHWRSVFGKDPLDEALRAAWKTHNEVFPSSRKRLVFAMLLVGFAVSPLLWAVLVWLK